MMSVAFNTLVLCIAYKNEVALLILMAMDISFASCQNKASGIQLNYTCLCLSLVEIVHRIPLQLMEPIKSAVYILVSWMG